MKQKVIKNISNCLTETSVRNTQNLYQLQLNLSLFVTVLQLFQIQYWYDYKI